MDLGVTTNFETWSHGTLLGVKDPGENLSTPNAPCRGPVTRSRPIWISSMMMSLLDTRPLKNKSLQNVAKTTDRKLWFPGMYQVHPGAWKILSNIFFLKVTVASFSWKLVATSQHIEEGMSKSYFIKWLIFLYFGEPITGRLWHFWHHCVGSWRHQCHNAEQHKDLAETFEPSSFLLSMVNVFLSWDSDSALLV